MKKKQTETVMTGDECPLCNIVIAPADPEKVKRGGVNYHNSCLKKTTQPISRPVQNWFRFNQGLYVN